MLQEILQKASLPDILTMADGSVCETSAQWDTRRTEIIDLFSREVYGYMPEAPKQVTFTVKERQENQIAGLAFYERIEATFLTPKGPFTFPFDYYMPYDGEKVPVILLLQFSLFGTPSVFPVETLIREGFGAVQVYNGDIMRDTNDFSQGLGSMYLTQTSPWDTLAADAYAANRKRGETQWGMIGVWAFGAQRIMDFLWQQERVDKKRIAVAGHSRLGKTALWCAATDERFSLALISASGNSGASLHRLKTDKHEHHAQITEVFPFWFSKQYPKYAGKENEMPFDMHMLLASLAPRAFFVCSGSDDIWAGPETEYMCCVAASKAWEMLGKKGFVHPDRMPEAGDVFDEGDGGYSMHAGDHFMGQFEWDNVIRFMKKM